MERHTPLLDFSTLKYGDKIIDRDGDEHTFIALHPERTTDVVTYSEHGTDHWPVAMFPAPKTALYVNVYSFRTKSGVVIKYASNSSREEADRNVAKASRVACVRVEFTPGQFDE